MKQTLQIYCKNNNKYKDFPIGSSLLDIYNGFNLDFPDLVVTAKFNHRYEGLRFRVSHPKDVASTDILDIAGLLTHVRSLAFVRF